MTSTMGENRKVDFLSIRVDNLTAEELLDLIDDCVASKEICQIVGLNVDQALRVLDDPYSNEIFDKAKVVFTDGMPIIWMAKLLGSPIKERIAGPDLMLLVCRRAAIRGHSIFLLGSTQETVESAAINLSNQCPGLKIAGVYSPPYSFEKDDRELEKIINMLKASKADELFVGLGSPKQDIFIYENKATYDIPVSFSMGAAIDFIGGKVRRAPAWMSNCGLEWLYRAFQDPARLLKRYLIDDMRIIPIFVKALNRRERR